MPTWCLCAIEAQDYHMSQLNNANLVPLFKSLLNSVALKIGPSSVNFLTIFSCILQSVAQDWAIEAMPTLNFLKEGTIVDKVMGAKKDELQQKIAFHFVNLVQKA